MGMRSSKVNKILNKPLSKSPLLSRLKARDGLIQKSKLILDFSKFTLGFRNLKFYYENKLYKFLEIYISFQSKDTRWIHFKRPRAFKARTVNTPSTKRWK